MADLLAEELKSKETKWPKGSITFEELRQVRKDAGMPSGVSATRRFLANARAAGKVEYLEGRMLKVKRFVRAARYLFK